MKALSRRQWQFIALALLVFAALKVALAGTRRVAIARIRIARAAQSVAARRQ